MSNLVANAVRYGEPPIRIAAQPARPASPRRRSRTPGRGFRRSSRAGSSTGSRAAEQRDGARARARDRPRVRAGARRRPRLRPAARRSSLRAPHPPGAQRAEQARLSRRSARAGERLLEALSVCRADAPSSASPFAVWNRSTATLRRRGRSRRPPGRASSRAVAEPSGEASPASPGRPGLSGVCDGACVAEVVFVCVVVCVVGRDRGSTGGVMGGAAAFLPLKTPDGREDREEDREDGRPR